jgi:hypothetical protein
MLKKVSFGVRYWEWLCLAKLHWRVELGRKVLNWMACTRLAAIGGGGGIVGSGDGRVAELF